MRRFLPLSFFVLVLGWILPAQAADSLPETLPEDFVLEPLPAEGAGKASASSSKSAGLPPPPLWIPPLDEAPELSKLLEEDRLAEALPVLFEALQNPGSLASDQLYRGLDGLRQKLAKSEGKDLEHLIRSLRVAPYSEPSRRLLEGLIRVDPSANSAHDLGVGRALLKSAGEAEEFPADHYARYYLGRSLAQEAPLEAARALRPLVRSKRAVQVPELAGVASLLQASCLVRNQMDLEATQVLQRGRKRFGKVRLEPEGLLEPYFYHALANIHEGRKKFSLAMQEYRLLTSAYPDYPALEAARRDHDSLARELEEKGSRE